MNIDYELLRNDLIYYFGTAMTMGFPVSMLDIDRVEKASEEDLIQIALQNGFDFSFYEQKNYRK